MDNKDTKNALNNPKTRMIYSCVVKPNPSFTNFNKLAPNIVGIARKKVNSAATVLETPISNAPTIVAPERDTPGKTAAIT